MILTNYPFKNYELKQLISDEGEIDGVILHALDDKNKSITIKNSLGHKKLLYGDIYTQYMFYS